MMTMLSLSPENLALRLADIYPTEHPAVLLRTAYKLCALEGDLAIALRVWYSSGRTNAPIAPANGKGMSDLPDSLPYPAKLLYMDWLRRDPGAALQPGTFYVR